MLSRAASSLFWMARYLERAETQARLLDVSLTMALIDVPEDREEQLSVPLLVTGSRETFHELYPEITPQNLIDFLLLDDRHPASVFSVIRSARDNALHVRGNLSADVWESINLAWMELKELRHKGVTESNASRVFDWTRERSNVFRGAAYGTLLRNDAFHFLLLGTFIERADATARVLNIRHHMATKSLEGHPTQSFFEWTALLHSLAAFEAYQNTYAQYRTDECGRTADSQTGCSPFAPRLPGGNRGSAGADRKRRGPPGPAPGHKPVCQHPLRRPRVHCRARPE